MSKTAPELLNLIETVSFDDVKKLDEIDFLVLQYICFGCCSSKSNNLIVPKYTRSRDTLKAARPKGWSFFCNPSWCIAETKKYIGKDGNKLNLQSPAYMRNEELAELHVIIQASEWERNNGG